jgi:molybdenum cofactor synthesis domain-containing protein
MNAHVSGIGLEDATRLVLSAAGLLESVDVPLVEACNRVLRQDVFSDIDYPTADVSAVDGFCLDAASTVSASDTRPVRISFGETIRAGSGSGFALSPGDCARIVTGGVIACNSDAVVKEEEVGVGPDHIVITNPVGRWENVRRKGEVARVGDKLLGAGHLLNPAGIGVLASFGVCTVKVSRKPRVVVVAVGDELVSCCSEPASGSLRSSNGHTVITLLAGLGCDIVDAGICGDDEDQIASTLRGCADCDIIITTGGVSQGIYDLVPGALEGMGARVLFRGLRLRPGKSAVSAVLGDVICLCLPGNPMACFVVFWLLVRPTLLSMMGCLSPDPAASRAVAACNIPRRYDVKTAVPARCLSDFRVEPIAFRGSADVVSLAMADCLIIVEPHLSPVKVGETVDILMVR